MCIFKLSSYINDFPLIQCCNLAFFLFKVINCAANLFLMSIEFPSFQTRYAKLIKF